MSEARYDGAEERRERVAATLEQLRAGVRQRQAELATGVGTREEVRLRLIELKNREFLQDPPCFSHRPLVGRFVVLVRKAAFHLFMKWYLHPLIHQQNGFNQVASRLIQELVEANDQLRAQVARLEARVRAAEEHLGE